jgi:outer membrane protein assembly factor BamB
LTSSRCTPFDLLDEAVDGGNRHTQDPGDGPYPQARFTTPVLKDGVLYGYNNGLFCASAENGATLWTDNSKRGQSAAILDAGSVILALTLNGELAAFKASSTEYTELVRVKVVSTETWAHPVIAGKRVFVRDSETVGLWLFE